MSNDDWSRVRDLFPAARKYVYLNAAGAPPMSAPAAAAGRRFYDEMLADGDVPWEAWLAEVESVRRTLAAFLGVDAADVAFTDSSSHGMNLVAHMLRGRGDVVTMRDEFPTATLPWLQQGYTVRFVPSGPAGVIGIDDIASAVTDRTRIIVTSSVQYATGFRQDIGALGSWCRERDLFLVVDACQQIGVLPLDAGSTGIDALVFSGYKWPMAGYGVGGLVLTPRLRESTSSPVAGWMSARDPDRHVNDRLDLKPSASVVEVGCPAFPGIFALGAALDLLTGIGMARIEARVHQLTDHLHERLRDRGFRISSPTDRCHRSAITIVELQEAHDIVKRLAASGILVSARGAGVRFSVHVYNTLDDIDRAVDAL